MSANPWVLQNLANFGANAGNNQMMSMFQPAAPSPPTNPMMFQIPGGGTGGVGGTSGSSSGTGTLGGPGTGGGGNGVGGPSAAYPNSVLPWQPGPNAPVGAGASNDPGVFTSNPYMKDLNQNVYGWQGNQYGSTLNQGNFNNWWDQLNQAFQGGGDVNSLATNPGMFMGAPTNSYLGRNPFDPQWSGSLYGTGTGIMQPSAALNAYNAANPQPGGNTPFQPPAGGGVTNGPGGNTFGQPGPGSNSNPVIGAPPAGSQPTQPSQPPPGQNFDPGQMFQMLQQLFGGGNTNGNLFGSNPGSGTGNLFSPPNNNANPLLPGSSPTPGTTQPVGQPGQGGDTASAVPTADQALAGNASNIGFLQNMVQANGAPIDQTNAWQQMVAAQQRQLQENQSNLTAQFDSSGNRFSTGYGTALTDYWNQAGLGQNAMLGQMQSQALESAAQRALSGDTTLAGIGQQSLSQLSGQGFQSQMAQQQQQLQAALAMMGYGSQAAGNLNNISAGATNQLNNLSAGATQGMFGAETNAAMMQPQLSMMLQQMGLSGANALNSGWNQNLQTGNTLGATQFNQNTQNTMALYQQFMQNLPQYNPLLQMMMAGATGYPPMVYPQYQPGWFGQLSQGIGQLAGAAGAAAAI